MKKFLLSLVGVYMIVASSVLSLEAVISSAAMGAFKGLMPILEPIARELILKNVQDIRKLILEDNCPDYCINPTLGQCMKKPIIGTNFLGSRCKGKCQHLKIIGGYEIRIRFGVKNGEHWDLIKCVRQAVESGYQDFLGKNEEESEKNKKKSPTIKLIRVAVYSQEDLDNLLSLIALQMAAEQVIGKGEAKEGKTVNETAEESQKLIDHITTYIKNKIKEGKYGYQ
jgi:hypothetical protein